MGRDYRSHLYKDSNTVLVDISLKMCSGSAPIFKHLFPFHGIGHPSKSSEKAMAPHSSTFAWKIPWTEEPGRLQSMGS